jgi:hypothetical protein
VFQNQKRKNTSKAKEKVGKKTDNVIYYSNTLSDHGVALRGE